MYVLRWKLGQFDAAHVMGQVTSTRNAQLVADNRDTATEGITMMEYNPETYWSKVAQDIQKRGENYIAGDDDPYHRYKRRKFLQQFLDTIDFQSKVALEVGFGPGGNLKHIATHHAPKKLFGADISQDMLEIATKNLKLYDSVELKKIDGEKLPYPDQSADISFTVTVLQHNTDERMFRSLVRELCRVTKTTIVIMEDIGQSQELGGNGEFISRQVGIYKSIFAEYGFQLSQRQFLNTKISRWWYWKIISYYARFIASQHKEGDPIGGISKALIGLPLPISRVLDRIFVDEADLAKMVFYRV
jgi:ubiquinone/menaquinone biosynthesis C-methylase UbiE